MRHFNYEDISNKYMMAVCEDKYGNIDNTNEYVTYFINNTRQFIDEIVLQVGRYSIVNGVLIQRYGEILELEPLGPMDYLEVVKNDYEDFKFTLWYYMIIRIRNKKHHLFYQIPKNLSMPQCDNIPIIKKRGYLALNN